MPEIVSIAAFKSQKLQGKIETVIATLNDADLHTLQNDVLVAPYKRSILPEALKESFREWLNDSYDPIEREDKMAPENQVETECVFLEESIDSDDEELAAQARMLLAHGQLRPHAIEHIADQDCPQ